MKIIKDNRYKVLIGACLHLVQQMVAVGIVSFPDRQEAECKDILTHVFQFNQLLYVHSAGKASSASAFNVSLTLFGMPV